MGVLSVEVDQSGPDLGQGRHGRHAPVDPGPRPSLRGDGPGQDHLFVVDDEAPLDEGLVGAGAHEDGIGPSAHEELERLHEQASCPHPSPP